MTRLCGFLFSLAGVVVVPIQVATAEKLPPGLVLHFNFDDIRKNEVPNLAGPIGNGAGNEARFVPVKGFGQAFFVRQNDVPRNYVEVPDHPALNGKAFTVAAWVCPRRTGISGSIACKHDWLDAGYRGFTLRSDAKDQMNFTLGAGDWRGTSSQSLLQPNIWVHVAGTFDGSKATVYFNGKPEESNEIPDEYEPSPFPLRVGHGAFKLDRHRKFDGKIDDLMIWNRCLTATEVLAVSKIGEGKRPPPPTAAEIAPLVQRLADEDYPIRQAANEELLDMGPGIIPELEMQMKNPEPEIRVRLRVLLRKLKPAS